MCAGAGEIAFTREALLQESHPRDISRHGIAAGGEAGIRAESRRACERAGRLRT